MKQTAALKLGIVFFLFFALFKIISMDMAAAEGARGLIGKSQYAASFEPGRAKSDFVSSRQISKVKAQQLLSAVAQPFIENRGQADERVSYYLKAGTGAIYLTRKGEVVFDSIQAPKNKAKKAILDSRRPLQGQNREKKVQRVVFKIIPETENQKIIVRGGEKARARINYFVGPRENWKSAVPTYREVEYEGIFPGTKTIYKAGRGFIEDVYKLAPGADPGAIRFKVEGAELLALDADGDLVIRTAAGECRFKTPAAWQEINGRKSPVVCNYVVKGNSYGFKLGPYDPAHALIIDPELSYATYLGGASGESSSDFFVYQGRVFLAGNTSSSNFPTSTGVFQTSYSGYLDGFLTVIEPLGQGASDLVYSTYLGGTDNDACNAITMSGSRVYLAGYTASSDFPVTTGAYQTSSGGYLDGFLTVIEPQGQGASDLVYSTYLGGADNDACNAITVSGSRAYLAGYTKSSDFPATTGSFQAGYRAYRDGFLTVIEPQGQGASDLVYSTYLGGTDNDTCNALAVSGGRAYLAGETSSIDFPAPENAYQSTLKGGEDGFLTVIEPLGQGVLDLVYSTYLGGADNDSCSAISIYGDLAYLGGGTSSVDFPVSASAYQLISGGSRDAFLSVIKPLGQGASDLVYSTYLGGSNNDACNAINVQEGRVYLAGDTSSLDFPAYITSYQANSGGSTDAFLVIFDVTVPVVESIYPADGAMFVPPNAVILATFNDNLDPATINNNNFILTYDSGAGAQIPVSGMVTYMDMLKTVSFKPDQALPFNTTFTATITAGIKNVFGNPLLAEYSWDFKTRFSDDDADGDGVSDYIDDFPTDASKCTVRCPAKFDKITIDVSGTAGASLAEVQAVLDSAPNINQANKPDPSEYIFPDGLLSFKITGLPVNPQNPATVSVVLAFPTSYAAGAKYYKASALGFEEFTGADINGNTVTLTLTDGGAGDSDGLVNGEIFDPGGPAQPADNNSGGGNCFISTLLGR